MTPASAYWYVNPAAVTSGEATRLRARKPAGHPATGTLAGVKRVCTQFLGQLPPAPDHGYVRLVTIVGSVAPFRGQPVGGVAVGLAMTSHCRTTANTGRVTANAFGFVGGASSFTG